MSKIALFAKMSARDTKISHLMKTRTNVKHKKDTDYCIVYENTNKIAKKVTKLVFRVNPLAPKRRRK